MRGGRCAGTEAAPQAVVACAQPGEGSWATPPFYIERLKAFIPDGPIAGRICGQKPAITQLPLVSCAQAPSRPEGRAVCPRGRSAATSLDGAEHSSKIECVVAAKLDTEATILVPHATVHHEDIDAGRERPLGRARGQGHRAQWGSLTPLTIDLFSRCSPTAAKNAARYVAQAEGRNARPDSKLATRGLRVGRTGCVLNLRR